MGSNKRLVNEFKMEGVLEEDILEKKIYWIVIMYVCIFSLKVLVRIGKFDKLVIFLFLFFLFFE